MHLTLLALDMCVPPLALFALILSCLMLASLLMMILEAAVMPWLAGVLTFFIFGTGILLAWLKFGRNILGFRSLAFAPIYALSKIPVYIKFLVRRQVEWVRSRRD